MKKMLLLVLLTGTLTSCSLLMPKMSATQKSMVENVIKRQGFKKIKYLGNTSSKSKKLRAGQWVTKVTRFKDGSNISITTTRIIKATRNKVVIESTTLNATDDAKPTHAQIIIKNFPLQTSLASTPEQMNKLVKKIKIIGSKIKLADGTVHETPAYALKMSNTQAEQFLNAGVSSNGKKRRTACKSKWIKGKKCLHYSMSVSAMGFSSNSKVWVHSSIPIDGVLKIEDDKTVTETIAYGYKRGKSKF